MNTSFGGNQVGSFVTLDVAGSYPLGALSQLGPYYNYSQDGMVAQTRYTATQAELTAQQGADYALKNSEVHYLMRLVLLIRYNIDHLSY